MRNTESSYGYCTVLIRQLCEAFDCPPEEVSWSSWPQYFPTTAGPRKGIAGQAITEFQVFAFTIRGYIFVMHCAGEWQEWSGKVGQHWNDCWLQDIRGIERTKFSISRAAEQHGKPGNAMIETAVAENDARIFRELDAIAEAETPKPGVTEAAADTASFQYAGKGEHMEMPSIKVQLEWLWQNCRIVYYPQPTDKDVNPYPLEHFLQHKVNKDMRWQIERYMSGLEDKA